MPPPGAPELLATIAPVTRPWSALSSVCWGTSSSSAPDTVSTELGRLTLASCVARPVTTSSSTCR